MQTDLTKGSPLKVILKFVLPLFIGNVFQQFYNMVDTIIVGHYVGADALAAVGSTGSIMFLIFGLTTGLSVGFTVLTSQREGHGRREDLCRKRSPSGTGGDSHRNQHLPHHHASPAPDHEHSRRYLRLFL